VSPRLCEGNKLDAAEGRATLFMVKTTRLLAQTLTCLLFITGSSSTSWLQLNFAGAGEIL